MTERTGGYGLHVEAPAGAFTEERLRVLDEVLRAFPGPCEVFLHLARPGGSTTVLRSRRFRVARSDALVPRIEALGLRARWSGAPLPAAWGPSRAGTGHVVHYFALGQDAPVCRNGERPHGAVAVRPEARACRSCVRVLADELARSAFAHEPSARGRS